MIIGTIPETGITIDSSLLEEISLHCKVQRCPVKACCYRKVHITKEEKEAIQSHTAFHLLIPNQKVLSTVELTGITDLQGDLKTVSSLEDRHEKCIFLTSEHKCTLETPHLKPKSCKTYPISLHNNKLTLLKDTESCILPGNTPAFELLSKELSLLLTPTQHTNLTKFLYNHNPQSHS